MTRADKNGPPTAFRARDRGDAATGALLGTFVGDALGMPFEGLPAEAIPDRPDMVAARRGRGTYTDDTQMMIALAESLVEQGEIVEEHLARAFLDAYDPERGYGSGTRRVFELWERGTPLTIAARQLFGGQGSRSNGAAMRIAPVAVRFADDPPRLLAQAARSARLTHAHPVGTDAAVVQAAAIGAALRGEPILETAVASAHTDAMRSGLAVLAPGGFNSPAAEPLRASSDACESVCAAISSAVAHPSPEAALTFAVRLGGDTDTVAAMTGAIVGARDGARALPARWITALEDDPRGRSHVERLASLLATPPC